MSLVLKPHIKEMSRSEIEQFISIVQARRLAAAVTYHQTRLEKYRKLSQKQKERLEKRRQMLGKALDACEKAIDTVELRLQQVEEAEHESGILETQADDLAEKLEE